MALITFESVYVSSDSVHCALAGIPPPVRCACRTFSNSPGVARSIRLPYFIREYVWVVYNLSPRSL